MELPEAAVQGLLRVPQCTLADDPLEVFFSAVSSQGPGLLVPPGYILQARLLEGLKWVKRARKAVFEAGWLEFRDAPYRPYEPGCFPTYFTVTPGAGADDTVWAAERMSLDEVYTAYGWVADPRMRAAWYAPRPWRSPGNRRPPRH